jgi:glycosyltransferase involved in cell wall biosynthesis
MMKISFGITVSTELNEIKKLVPFILKNKKQKDEIIVLYDEKNGNPEVLDFLLPFNNKPNVQTWRSNDWNDNFADWKNKLNSYCSGDYILQLDADEMINEYLVKNIHEMILLNPEIDLYYLPRINTVDGITEEHIKKWGWRLDSENRINHPDYQGRLYKKGLMWEGKVHEKIINQSKYGILPEDILEYSIIHNKTITKQEKQNIYYNNL